MNLRPLLHSICILCFLALSSCINKKSPSNTVDQTRKDSSFIYFEKGKNSEAIPEKISNFNKALQVIKNEKDTLIPDILDYKIYYHVTLKEYDSTLYFSDSLINVAKAQKDSGYIAKGFYRKSTTFRALNQNEKQFENAYAAREIYLKIGDTANAGRRTVEMAIAQSQMTDYTGAQQTATEALEYLEEDDSEYLSSIYNTIATSYRSQGLYNDATNEWRNALRYASTTRDSLSNLNNIALTLQDQKEYDKAHKDF